jgi:tetratricopeptide (TPR) repeat protein
MLGQWSHLAVGVPSLRAWRRLAWLWAVAMAIVLAAATWYGVRAGREAQRVVEGARLVAAGEYGAAVRALLPVVTAAPEQVEGHYYLGLAYRGLGLPTAALVQLQEAVRLAPGDARLHAGLSGVYRDAGEANHALADLEDAARRDPGNPQYPVAIAGILLDQGHAEQATGQLRSAVQLKPRAPDLHLLLAVALRQAGDHEAAATECREVIRLADGAALAELARQECRTMQVQHPTLQGGIRP